MSKMDMKKGYKFVDELEIQIPKDWEEGVLGVECGINPGISISGSDRNRDVSFIPMDAVGENCVGITKRVIKKQYEVERGYTRFAEGDILFAKITPCMENGKIAIAENLVNGVGFGSTEFLVVRPSEKIFNRWLFYWMTTMRFRRRAETTFRGVAGQQRVQKEFLENEIIPIPPLPEQRKIAEILTTVDDAIQKNAQVIEKAERIKRGAMERLLTRGIGHQKFKFVDELEAEIPEEWKLIHLSDATRIRKELVSPEDNPGHKYIGLEHVDSGTLKISRSGMATEVKSTKFKFYKGDILYGKLRPYLDKVGFAEYEGVCSTDLLVLKTNNGTDPNFMLYVLHSKSFIEYTKGSMKGTNHPRISSEALLEYYFACPPLPEQRKIAEILTSIDEYIQTQKARKAKLERIKAGLMEDLLTGKRRVVG